MADSLRPDGFLVAAVVCAVLGGPGTGLFQGLVGGSVAALLFWEIVAVTISGFSPGSPAEISTLMRPQVSPGSFFSSLSVFLYALVGGALLGPDFGTLVNRAARAGAKGELR